MHTSRSGQKGDHAGEIQDFFHALFSASQVPANFETISARLPLHFAFSRMGMIALFTVEPIQVAR